MTWQLILMCMAAVVNCQSIVTLDVAGQVNGLTDQVGGLISTSVGLNLRGQETRDSCPVCKCGIPNVPRNQDGGINEFPWIASLKYNEKFYCEAILINDMYVITTVACTTGNLRNRLGISFVERDQAGETKNIERQVVQIIPHFGYNSTTFDNDIALLKLDRRIEQVTQDSENRGPRPVCLPRRGQRYSNNTAVAGWSTIEEGNSVPRSTFEELSVISNEQCRRTAARQPITDNMLCATGRDVCQEVIGGSLYVVNSTTQEFEEIGIKSWDGDCAQPVVYTRVNQYLSWIESNTGDACYCQ